MRSTKPRSRALQKAEQALRAHALSYPEAREEFPWGHSAFKVKTKVFLFMGTDDGSLSLSCKLPETKGAALLLPFAEPTGYGLGKSGWVSALFTGADGVPVDMLEGWIDESYRAIAPKKLVALRDGTGDAAKPNAAAKPTSAAKPRKAKPPAKAKPSAKRTKVAKKGKR